MISAPWVPLAVGMADGAWMMRSCFAGSLTSRVSNVFKMALLLATIGLGHVLGSMLQVGRSKELLRNKSHPPVCDECCWVARRRYNWGNPPNSGETSHNKLGNCKDCTHLK